jgi:dTMP kinase
LAEGQWVVSDRFVDASRAYQGGGRGLPMDRVETLADWVLGELTPDLTVLLDAPVDMAMARTRSRGNEDRMDSEQTAFYERVREAYLGLAAAEAERFVVVDASGTVDEVARQIDAAVQKLLGSC